ncbi:MAG: phosphotransferase [Nitrospirae bacterium]|nr:phosphotransferase [Candidatus Manganitrophaceae bacterium]
MSQEHPMIERERLIEKLQETFKTPIISLQLKALTGDASDRVYYRVSWKKDTETHSHILMEMGDTKNAVTSEEITGKTTNTHFGLPFINIQKYLSACKIPVPEVFFYDKGQAWILLEDLGDLSFADEVNRVIQSPEKVCEYYKNAIDLLISLQLQATPILARQCVAHTRHYDQCLFEWEFDHFIEYGIEKRNKTPLAPEIKSSIRSHFSQLSAHFSAQPSYFTHRDYHSRNLMMQDSPEGLHLRLIDFQDALMGPAEYDLASLLRDSYIDLSHDMIETLLDYYIQEWKKRAALPIDSALFKESFDLISIQRNLKAAGRFIYIDQVKGKDYLLPFVTPTLLKVKNTLQKYERLKPLYDLLAEAVPELQ